MRTFLAAILLIFMVSALPAYAQNEVNTANAVADNSAGGTTSAPQVPARPDASAEEVTPPNAAGGPQVLPESGQALVKLFVLAALLESALALLFNWRPFVATLDGRAVKPLLSFGAALVVVFTFGLDDLETLLEAYGSSPIQGDGERVSQIIEAMIIAGGANGVNSLLRSLGFRAIPTAEVEKKPPATEAWLSVGLHRVRAVGPVQVVTDPGGELGTIHGTMRRRGFFGFFLRDKGRLPQSAGKSVPPGKELSVTLHGRDADGNDLPSPAAQKIKPAAGALIDLEFTL